MRLRILVLLVLLATGCVTAPTKTASLESALDYTSTARLVFDQARQCWPSQVTAIKKGIRLSISDRSSSSFAFAAYRVEWSGRPPKEPFITVTVTKAEERAKVDVVESEFTCGLVNGCVNLGLKEDVASWLTGNTTCRDIGKTLLSLGLGF
jgi:hypothetical protein